jgi:hypothetical protein
VVQRAPLKGGLLLKKASPRQSKITPRPSKPIGEQCSGADCSELRKVRHTATRPRQRSIRVARGAWGNLRMFGDELQSLSEPAQRSLAEPCGLLPGHGCFELRARLEQERLRSFEGKDSGISAPTCCPCRPCCHGSTFTLPVSSSCPRIVAHRAGGVAPRVRPRERCRSQRGACAAAWKMRAGSRWPLLVLHGERARSFVAPKTK